MTDLLFLKYVVMNIVVVPMFFYMGLCVIFTMGFIYAQKIAAFKSVKISPVQLIVTLIILTEILSLFYILLSTP